MSNIFAQEALWLAKNPEFRMRPATIQEFCGPGYLNERNVRPGIMAALIETFGEDVNPYAISDKRRALLTGAIGIGKSTYAAIALSYMVHWIKCLKNPKEFYNLSEDSVIGFMMMSTTEKLAQEVIFQKVKKRIQNSVWFQNWAPLAEENRRMQKQMRFEGDIWIVPGSSAETSFEGYDILGGIVDEGDCVDAETEILTSTGWKHYDTLNVGDLILTLNHETGLSEWQPVDDVKIYDGPRKMVKVEGERFSSMTTYNHRWPVERPRVRGGVTHNDRVWTTTRDMGFHDKIIKSAMPADRPIVAKYSDAMVELVAWFYTEGCDPYKNGKTAYITQSPKVNSKNCGRIRAALTNEFGPAVESFPRQGKAHDGVPRWREKFRSRGEYWGDSIDFVLSVAAGEAIQSLCHGKVPSQEFLMSLTLSQLELFIKVSMLADNNGKRRFAQKDRSAAEAFAFACILAGYPVTVRQASSGMWCVYSPKTNTIAPVRASTKSGMTITEVDYDDVIWCPTVKNHSWMARRNGVTYFTGNSHNVTDTKDYAEAGYNTIESRIESRFTDFKTGQHRGLMICIGQAKRKGGFMLRHYEDFDKDPDSVAVRMTIWESFGWYNYTKDKEDIKRKYETAERDSFYYDIRKRILLSKEAAQQVMNKDLIEVPTQYQRSFERDPVKALRDLAGIPPEVDDPFISRPDFILDCQELWHERFPEYDSPVGTESRLDKIVLPSWFSPASFDGSLRRVIHIDTAYCVDDLTEVLTQRGWLRYDQIEIGDKTLGLDPVTHKARWDRINKLNIFDYDGELNSLETEGHSSLTTDNHRWYVDQRKFNNETRRYDSLEPAVVMSKDLNTRHTIIGAAEVENLPTERTQRDETVELVGWFWTEGHINRCRRTGKQLDGIEISQSWRVNEDNCKRIEACLRGLFGDPVDLFTRGGCKAPVKPEWRMHKSGGNIRFYLNSWIGKRLKTLAPDRRPTFEFISSLTREQLELFVEVSELADRTKPGCIAQKDGKSLEAVQMAYVLLGRRTAIRVNGNDMTVLSSYRESRRKIKYKPEIHKRVSYKGIVWCPTTDTGSWLARRNGKTYFTGNSPEGDALGFAMAHVPEKVDQYGEERPIIVFDLLLRIKATPSVEINFGEIRKFIYMLRDDLGFEIDMVTIDGFNSFDFIQQLRRNKVKSDYLSVDKTKAPYEDVREVINDRRCLIPKYMVHYNLADTKVVNIAYKELSEVQDTGKKIDHPKDGSKDIADAITGCVHTLVSISKYIREARTVEGNKSNAEKGRTVVTDANEMFSNPDTAAMKQSMDANSPVSFEDFKRAQDEFVSGGIDLSILTEGSGIPGFGSGNDRIW